MDGTGKKEANFKCLVGGICHEELVKCFINSYHIFSDEKNSKNFFHRIELVEGTLPHRDAPGRGAFHLGVTNRRLYQVVREPAPVGTLLNIK